MRNLFIDLKYLIEKVKKKRLVLLYFYQKNDFTAKKRTNKHFYTKFLNFVFKKIRNNCQYIRLKYSEY